MASINTVAGFAEPLRAYNFAVQFLDTDDSFAFHARSVDIPSFMELDTEKIRIAPTFDVELPSGFKKSSNVIIEFWEDENFTVMKYIKTWFGLILNMDSNSDYYMTYNLRANYIKNFNINIMTSTGVNTQIGPTSSSNNQSGILDTISGIGGIASSVAGSFGSVIGAVGGGNVGKIANALGTVSNISSTISKVAGTLSSGGGINSIGGALGAIGTIASGVGSIIPGVASVTSKIGTTAGIAGSILGELGLSGASATLQVINAYPVSVESLKFSYGESSLVSVKVEFEYESVDWL